MFGFRFRLLNDRTLVQLIRSGNEEALTLLYARTWKQTYRFVLKGKGRIRDAEEMLAEALLTTWQHVIRQKQEQVFALVPYVLAVARNRWNKKKKPGKGASSAGKHKKPDEAFSKEWHKLSEPDRRLLGLYYFDGFNLKQVAELTGMPGPDAARQRRSELLKQLREGLDQEKFLA